MEMFQIVSPWGAELRCTFIPACTGKLFLHDYDFPDREPLPKLMRSMKLCDTGLLQLFSGFLMHFTVFFLLKIVVCLV